MHNDKHTRAVSRFRVRAIFLFVCAAISAVLPVPAFPPAHQATTKNVQVVATNAMVASAHALASQAGLEIMKAGGNAVDGAVAAAFAIGVVEPNASGIGGEGMIVIYRADKKAAVAIDYRSAAPATAQYSSAIPATGHAAVAIPGTVAGLTSAVEQYGTMKLDKVLAPAIRLAERGFTVSPTLAAAIADSPGDFSIRVIQESSLVTMSWNFTVSPAASPRSAEGSFTVKGISIAGMKPGISSWAMRTVFPSLSRLRICPRTSKAWLSVVRAAAVWW